MARYMSDFDIEIAELWKAVHLLQQKLGEQRINNDQRRNQVHNHISSNFIKQEVVTIVEHDSDEVGEEAQNNQEENLNIVAEYRCENIFKTKEEVFAESDAPFLIEWSIPPVYDDYPKDNSSSNLIDASRNDDDYTEYCITVSDDDLKIEVSDKPLNYLIKSDSDSTFEKVKDDDHMNAEQMVDSNLVFDNITNSLEDPFWSKFALKYAVLYASNQIRLLLEVNCLQFKARMLWLKYIIVRISSTNIMEYVRGWSNFTIVCATKFWFARKPKIKAWYLIRGRIIFQQGENDADVVVRKHVRVPKMRFGSAR